MQEQFFSADIRPYTHLYYDPNLSPLPSFFMNEVRFIEFYVSYRFH